MYWTYFLSKIFKQIQLSWDKTESKKNMKFWVCNENIYPSVGVTYVAA